MERITQRTAVAAALMLVLTAAGLRAITSSAAGDADPATGHEQSVAGAWIEPVLVVEGDRAAHELVDWALERFELARLQLPPRLVIRFHDESAECGGAPGRCRLTGDDPPVIDLCVPFDRYERRGKSLTLHELGHAWAETQLDAGARTAFLQVRELDTWVEPETPTHLWGAEQAAEIISWALVDEPFRIVRFENAEPDALCEAYEVLTGAPVPARQVDGTL